VKVYFAGKATFEDEDGTLRDLKSVVLNGFNQWVKATESKISYVITDRRVNADIIIKWEQRAGSIQDEDSLAVTDLTYNPKIGTMSKAIMVFYIWDEMSASQALHGLKKTAAHEFAHALGMRGHSGNPNDVMFDDYDPDKFSPLTKRDVNTMKTQYCSLFR
jgi:predicted Zn-dependent protease